MIAPRILCVGAIFWESIFQVDSLPAGGGKLLARAGRQHASGMAPAAAIAAVRLGARVSLVSRLGDDPAGTSARIDLGRSGIDVSAIQVRAGLPTPFSTVLVEPRGERRVIPCVDDRLFEGTDGIALEALAGAAVVLADVRWPEAAQALMGEARRRGIPTVLDADVAPLEVLERLMPLADHLLLSQQALALIEDDAEPDCALHALARRMPAAQLLCVTLGPGGVALIDRASAPDHVIRVEAFVVDAVDTLNAGDVWHGCYAWALGCGLPALERVRWANAAAAIKCTRPWGRVGVPDRDEVRRFLEARR